MRDALPVQVEMAAIEDGDLLALVASEPFRGKPSGGDLKWSATFLVSAARRRPRLPIEKSTKDGWRIRVFAARPDVFFSLYRVVEGKPADINGLVEREFGIAATTRTWDTVLAIHRKLRDR